MNAEFASLVEGHLPARGKSPDVARRHPSRRFWVRVGQPVAVDDNYCCPLVVEGFFEGTKQVMGAAPLDSLMNAMVLVKRYFNYVNGLTDEPLPQFE
ncbi:MAG: hypothetical protein U0228_28245 [Myxococcaceae bacterium]